MHDPFQALTARPCRGARRPADWPPSGPSGLARLFAALAILAIVVGLLDHAARDALPVHVTAER